MPTRTRLADDVLEQVLEDERLAVVQEFLDCNEIVIDAAELNL
jgi:hypothetical protein